MESITRRTFLSLSGLAALSLAARFPSLEDNPPPAAFVKLGRATRSLRCYDKPAFSAQEICTHHTDSVLNIHEEKLGETDNPHNAIWFQVDDGWVYSSFVQPVRNVLNSPLQSVPATGRLVEVTVPFTEAWRNEDGELSIAYRFYYNSTHWVEGVVSDPKGNAWYRVIDDRYRVYYFVLAKHLRPVADDELAPLAQATTDKRVEIDLARQQLTAYEDGVAVRRAHLSSGRPGSDTPLGTFQVRLKRPARHMAASEGAGNGFDLPGVPWVSYFHWTGVAFHGTYWHNDYGRPRSRGCINLRPEDAQWIYRWTAPTVPPGKPLVEKREGTKVIVF